MSTHTPTVLVALVTKPIVAKNLGVKVMCLKRTMVNMRLWPLKEEEAVVINGNIPTIQASEGGDIISMTIVYDLAKEISVYNTAINVP